MFIYRRVSFTILILLIIIMSLSFNSSSSAVIDSTSTSSSSSSNSSSSSTAVALSVPNTNDMAVQVANRIKASYLCMMIGDSLSMPVHWYYNVRDIQRDYGKITDFQAPKSKHPSSIMSLSNTGGGGRGDQKGSIIGDIINHGKKQYWGVPNVHYHQGMRAGENTLNALVARVLTRALVANQGNYTPSVFYNAYIPFMTTPNTHNDTYAETYHRMFFKNYGKGLPPEQCSEDDGHNIASMGGFVLLPMVNYVTACSYGSLNSVTIKKAQEQTVIQMYTTHKSKALQKHAEIYSELLTKVLYGQDLRQSIQEAGEKLKLNIPLLVQQVTKEKLADTDVIGGMFSPACYIEDSFPSLLYLAYRYHNSIEDALIANTNVGGENAHRGSALGALMGLALGMEKIPGRWINGLVATKEIMDEADNFSKLCAQRYVQASVEGGTIKVENK